MHAGWSVQEGWKSKSTALHFCLTHYCLFRRHKYEDEYRGVVVWFRRMNEMGSMQGEERERKKNKQKVSEIRASEIKIAILIGRPVKQNLFFSQSPSFDLRQMPRFVQ